MEHGSANIHASKKAVEMTNFILLTVLVLVLPVHSAPSIPTGERVKLGALIDIHSLQ